MVIGDLIVSLWYFVLFVNVQNYNLLLFGCEMVYGCGEIYGLIGFGDIIYLGVLLIIDFYEQLIVQGGYIL